MRTLSTAALQAITGQETTEVFVVLVTIDHDFLDDPLRFSTDPTELVSTSPLLYKTVSRGDDYFFVPTEVTLPDDADGTALQAKLKIANVGREQIALLRSVLDPASVTIEVVLASDPDTVQVSLPVLDLVGASWDGEAVELTLTVESMDQEPYPGGNYDPASFPSLF